MVIFQLSQEVTDDSLIFSNRSYQLLKNAKIISLLKNYNGL
jgi:hypothetical protein